MNIHTQRNDAINPGAWRVMLETTDDECITRTSFMPTGRGGSLLRVETWQRPERGMPARAEGLVHVPEYLFKEAAEFRYEWLLMAETRSGNVLSQTFGISMRPGSVVRTATRQLGDDGALLLLESLTFAPASRVMGAERGGRRLAA